MAYVAFDESGVAEYITPQAASAPALAPAPTRPLPASLRAGRLSALEWSVVAIARKDRLSSLRSPSRLSTAMRSVFREPNPRLADERLEALRRMAVLSWHGGYRVAESEVEAFIAAGFTMDQYEIMLDSIAAARNNRERRR